MALKYPDFKDRYPDLQHLVQELLQTRKHNLIEARRRIAANAILAEADRERLIQQQDMLLGELPPTPDGGFRQFAEAALVLTTLERFLRVVVDRTGKEHDGVTLYNLLEQATSKKKNLITYPAGSNRASVTERITLLRNTMLHGNYEQLAAHEKCADVPEFFQTSFLPAVEEIYRLTEHLMKQIDVRTGKRVRPEEGK